MGRMVWFPGGIVAFGFGVPAAPVIAGAVLVLGCVFWLGRRSVSKPAEPESQDGVG